MSLDIARLRAETPGSRHVVHLNNAGASLPPQPVIDAVRDYHDEEACRGGYETAEAHRSELEGTYDSLAGLLGADRREVAVLDSATRAWDMAFYSLDFGEGDRIVTTSTEYAANYIAYLQVARRTGAVVEVVADTPGGEIDVEALATMLDDRVKLVSINHMPTNGGLVNPAAAVGRVTRAAGVPYLLDACQTAGQIPIDVEEIGCDFLSGTSRKYLRGPRGVGFLYVRGAVLENTEPIMLDLHGATWLPGDRYEMRPDARRFELWEQSMGAKAGFKAALDYAAAVGVQAGWDRIRSLAASLRSMLASLPGVDVWDLGTQRGGIVTFTVSGLDPASVKRQMRERAINVWTVTPAAARVDMDRRGIAGLVRASVHYFNTDDDLHALVAAVADLKR
ncbi:MAG: aminotransferase class V-fold PLP-dependent enzyme [Acidimicrobiia bacterium]